MKLNYSKLAYSFLMAAAVVVIGVLFVLAIVGLVALFINHPAALIGVLALVAFSFLWADAYKFA